MVKAGQNACRFTKRHAEKAQKFVIAHNLAAAQYVTNKLEASAVTQSLSGELESYINKNRDCINESTAKLYRKQGRQIGDLAYRVEVPKA